MGANRGKIKVKSVAPKRGQGSRLSNSSAKKTPTVKHSEKKPAMTKAARGCRMWRTQLLTNSGVRQMLINLAGENTLHVIGEFDSQLSDEEIAKRTKLRTSDVRVVLNKLHSCGLVSYSRSRDKNSGWYSYVWKMNNERAQEIIQNLMHDSGQEYGIPVKEDAAAEGAEVYCCGNCPDHKEISFEEASGLLFRCSHCGSSLEYAADRK